MKRLTLSFDNGPSPAVTPLVLDLLRERDIRATFFVCGKDIQAPQSRALLERARRDGHRIGNHTMTHSVELGATADDDAPETEITAAQQVLGELADPDRLFRPYGAGGILGPRLLSAAAIRRLCDGGYTCVLWNSVPRDWEDTRGWPERALRDCDVQEWTLVVLHDVPTGAMKQLERFLDALPSAGIELSADLPPDCVPILRGQIVGALEHLCPS